MIKATLPPATLPGLTVVELGTGAEALLQRFFEENPQYFLSVNGEPPKATEAHEEIHDLLPAGWSYTRKLVLGYVAPDERLAAMANVVSDIVAPNVWNLSTFIVATERHGTGDAASLYRGLEAWAAQQGAQWLRLGVVAGNVRAERFWERQGYTQTRLRQGIQMGRLTNTLRVMFKPLAGGSLEQYLTRVARDRPEGAA
jgi:GNAT superfamily N-acetyltransferase